MNIKGIIAQVIEGKAWAPEADWKKAIKRDAAERLFKNTALPQDIEVLSDLKHPELTNLISNAPYHIIESAINEGRQNTRVNDSVQGIMIRQLMKYFAICIMSPNAEPELEKPDKRDTAGLIEYSTLYEVRVQIMIEEKYEEIRKSAEDMAKRLSRVNSEEDTHLKLERETLKRDVRQQVIMSKSKWVMWETILSLIDKKIQSEERKQMEEGKEKKRGPKKQNEEEKEKRKQMHINDMFTNNKH